jgi:Glycosyl hydrolases family 2, sugar binding domain
MPSRQQFLTTTAGAIAATLATSEVQATDKEAKAFPTNLASLCGKWLFRTDSADSGTSQHWYDADMPSTGWRQVNVPHTWQIEAPLGEYYGTAWYRRTFDVPADWRTFGGQGDIPVELQEVEIPELPPASSARLEVKSTQSEVPNLHQI